MGKRPALLVLDLINEIVHPDGKYGADGYERQVNERGVLGNAARAIERARAAGIPVIYVVVGFSEGYPEWPAGSPIFKVAKEDGRIQLGTWATEVHESVRPAAGEVVIAKHRISPFYGTGLDLLLRNQGIDTLLLTGVSTDMVILATARDAHDRDYAVEVLEDATAADGPEMHQAALKVIGRCATITTVDEALKADR
ncbi:cysteine hydrolase family protein [Streptomyces griseocarneus]|uniref:cysteine hydrolase family protein n=1 Tax=Streptomyces griseocarneus TaxID=51201 RepID=UPI00167EDB47|nr:isochorismatase family cysteine hydrolase [Streptomyces griseocarneus]MBZ6473136.1 cysteine hydrolase [Streptomyces griseocarneus]GHG60051.1 isochorismatase [Streptomyces griseocarneus]